MRAIVLDQQRSIDDSPLELRDVPFPEPGPRQIRIKVHCCGLCHTDLHIVEGDLPPHKLPVVPGHQIVGTVEKCGRDVTRFQRADRVGVPWLHRTDGDCEFCGRGLENLCEHAQFTGYDTDGGYAEFTLVDEDFAYPIPPQFTDENAAPLLCAGIIGYRSYRLSGVQAGDRLGLYGFGASAHIVIQFARHLGNEVYVFTRSENHRKHAEELGAVWTGRRGRASQAARWSHHLCTGWSARAGCAARHAKGWDRCLRGNRYVADSNDGLQPDLPRTDATKCC